MILFIMHASISLQFFSFCVTFEENARSCCKEYTKNGMIKGL